MKNSALLHPEMIASIPFLGASVANELESYAAQLPSCPQPPEPVSVVIRALNEAQSLPVLLDDFRRQSFSGEIELIVLDNESSDATADVAKDYGARVETIARDDFSYSRSLNQAMEAASHNVVVLTVGHAALATNVFLGTVQERFRGEAVAGAYGTNFA